MKQQLGILLSMGGAMLLSQCASTEKPNIVVILADDMGFSDLGCYGGEIETPHIDMLAQQGLRYRQFYNCARSCPSRAALVTGLYPHQAGMGWMAAADLGTAASQGYINNHCVTFGEVLKTAGYGTYMSGKWHLSSDRQNRGGVQDNWPNQRGFDRFYGIVGGAANYFSTLVNHDNRRVKSPDDGSFYFTDAIADNSVTFIDEHSFADSPLFMYVAFTAPHWPLHAREDDIAKYVERYGAGWDRLREERFARQKAMGLFPEGTVMSPRDGQVPAWDTLSEAEQHDFVMRMAIYAAQIEAMDRGIGRIVEKLRQKGQLDNTLIMFMSDNGACAEFISSGERKAVDGKGDTYESYRINWANLSSTPYREYKHFTNEGGIASPLVVRYPRGIKKSLNGTFVDEYGHFTDVMATCVALSGADYPKEYKGNAIVPMQGKSLAPNFTGGRTSRGMTLWEHEGNIAVRDGRWKIVTKTLEDALFDPSHIELYDMSADPTELDNLALKDPQRVSAMYAQWKSWADSIGVFPIDTREYNVRQRASKRERINGQFDDNFGDWGVVTAKNCGVVFSIDQGSILSGVKSARADIDGVGGRPLAAALKWVFTTDGKNRADVSFLGKSTDKTTIRIRLESLDKPGTKMFEKDVQLHGEPARFELGRYTLPDKGRYQLVFLFGAAEKSSCWIDDVAMKID